MLSCFFYLCFLSDSSRTRVKTQKDTHDHLSFVCNHLREPRRRALQETGVASVYIDANTCHGLMQSGDVCDGYHEMDEVPCWIREKITMRGIGACLQQDLNHRHTLTERPGKETFGKSERVGKAEKVGKLTFVNGWVYKCDNDGDQAGEFVPSDFEQKVDISQNWRRRKRKQESVEINRVNPGVGFDEVYAQVREISEDSRETHDNTVHGKDSMTQNRMWKKESDPMNGAGPNIHQRMNANTLDISSGLVSKQKRFGIPINKKSRQNGAEKNELLHRSKVFEEETLNVSEKMYIQLKAENEKLRMVVNDLQNHMEVVHQVIDGETRF